MPELEGIFLNARPWVLVFAWYSTLLIVGLCDSLNEGKWVGFATGLICLFFIPVLCLNDDHYFASQIVIQLFLSFCFWGLYLSTAIVSGFFCINTDATCLMSSIRHNSSIKTQVVAATIFLNWLLFTCFIVSLLIIAIKQHLRGNSGVWRRKITYPLPLYRSDPRIYSDGTDQCVWVDDYPSPPSPVVCKG